jgi:hypothetical protein
LKFGSVDDAMVFSNPAHADRQTIRREGSRVNAV